MATRPTQRELGGVHSEFIPHRIMRIPCSVDGDLQFDLGLESNQEDFTVGDGTIKVVLGDGSIQPLKSASFSNGQFEYNRDNSASDGFILFIDYGETLTLNSVDITFFDLRDFSPVEDIDFEELNLQYMESLEILQFSDTSYVQNEFLYKSNNGKWFPNNINQINLPTTLEFRCDELSTFNTIEIFTTGRIDDTSQDELLNLPSSITNFGIKEDINNIALAPITKLPSSVEILRSAFVRNCQSNRPYSYNLGELASSTPNLEDVISSSFSGGQIGIGDVRSLLVGCRNMINYANYGQNFGSGFFEGFGDLSGTITQSDLDASPNSTASLGDPIIPSSLEIIRECSHVNKLPDDFSTATALMAIDVERNVDGGAPNFGVRTDTANTTNASILPIGSGTSGSMDAMIDDLQINKNGGNLPNLDTLSLQEWSGGFGTTYGPSKYTLTIGLEQLDKLIGTANVNTNYTSSNLLDLGVTSISTFGISSPSVYEAKTDFTAEGGQAQAGFALNLTSLTSDNRVLLTDTNNSDNNKYELYNYGLYPSSLDGNETVVDQDGNTLGSPTKVPTVTGNNLKITGSPSNNGLYVVTDSEVVSDYDGTGNAKVIVYIDTGASAPYNTSVTEELNENYGSLPQSYHARVFDNILRTY